MKPRIAASSAVHAVYSGMKLAAQAAVQVRGRPPPEAHHRWSHAQHVRVTASSEDCCRSLIAEHGGASCARQGETAAPSRSSEAAR